MGRVAAPHATHQEDKVNQNQNYGLPQINSWISTASQQDLTALGETVLNRISQSDQKHRDAFVKRVQDNPQISRMFDKQPA
jgi:hypothetical protein